MYNLCMYYQTTICVSVAFGDVNNLYTLRSTHAPSILFIIFFLGLLIFPSRARSRTSSLLLDAPWQPISHPKLPSPRYNYFLAQCLLHQLNGRLIPAHGMTYYGVCPRIKRVGISQDCPAGLFCRTFPKLIPPPHKHLVSSSAHFPLLPRIPHNPFSASLSINSKVATVVYSPRITDICSDVQTRRVT